MDVQATNLQTLPPVTLPSLSAGSSGTSSSAPSPSGTSTPAAQVGLPVPASQDQTLTPALAKLFNTPQENVSVSFQVAQDSNDVVVVLSDASTGKTIAQFPSETLIAMAQFFNKLAGAVVDQKA